MGDDQTVVKQKDRPEGVGLACGWVLRDGVVVADVACEKCGYSLRTLAVEARCPECGEAVARSVRAGRVCFAERTWLRQLRTGLWLLSLGGFLVGIVLPVSMQFGGGPVEVGAFLLMVPVMAFSVFRVTQGQGTGGKTVLALTGWGFVARVGAVGSLGGLALITLGLMFDFIAVMFFGAVVGLSMTIGAAVGVMMHARQVAMLLNDQKLVAVCQMAAGLAGLSFPLAIVMAVVGAGRISELLILFAMPMCVIALGRVALRVGREAAVSAKLASAAAVGG